MKDRLSALLDGELDDKSAAELISELGRDPDAAQTWRTYNLISDAMRESRLLSAHFSTRFSERLLKEPTVLAPRAQFRGLQRAPQRWFAVSAAASVVAAVGLVGWLAFAPQPPVAQPVAQGPAEPKPPAMIPMPTAANDYLLAHQGFSPRLHLQGMAPYVRTVSEQTVEPRK